MNVKLLLVLTIVLCAFLVLPSSAYPVQMIKPDIDQTPTFTVTNVNNAYISLSMPYLSGTRIIAPTFEINGNTFNKYESTVQISSLSTYTTETTGLYNGQYVIIPYYRILTNNTESHSETYSYYTSSSGQKSFSVNFVFDENYQENFTAEIRSEFIQQIGDSITYDCYCYSDNPNLLYSQILSYPYNVNDKPINLQSEDTLSTFVLGEHGVYVYCYCLDTTTGNIKELSTYLYGTSEIIQPTVQPTEQPTDQPVYPTKITGYIQTFDYQSGNMISGVNMSVYEVIDHDTYAELGQMIYSSINAESQTILQLKNNTEYFVKNELTGYFAVKNENYPYFNNEYGYWWNPSLNNPLILYYNRLDPNAQYNANFIVQDVNNNGISGVSVTMDNTITKVSNSIGGLSFSNVSAGSHTFTFVKNGYQSAQRTIDIQMQYATFTQTLFKDNQIIQPTVQPTGIFTPYPTVQPTVQPTISPIEKPSNIADSVKYGLSKIFGVNSLDTINLVFALMLILFPAVIGGVITNQALGFIAGGMMGFVFALAIGLIPIWVFFAMVMFSVIYLILTHGTGEGF